MSWAIDGHCRKSGGVRFSATAIRAAPESASVIFLDENWEESRPREFEQLDKWIFRLTAARLGKASSMSLSSSMLSTSDSSERDRATAPGLHGSVETRPN
jgi:hypothetical protein